MCIQLHVFGEASETAFGSVTYFRFDRLCICRNRVAPINPLNIPRLQPYVLSFHMTLGEHECDLCFWTDNVAVIGKTRGTLLFSLRIVNLKFGYLRHMPMTPLP